MNEEERSRTVTYLYISYIFTICLFSVIYPLMKKRDCKEDEILTSHISWQLKTTVYTVPIYAFAYFLLQNAHRLAELDFQHLLGILVSVICLPVLTIWIFYRVIKGISKLADNKTI